MTTKHTPTPWQIDPMYWADIQTADGDIEVAGLRYDGMPDAINREPEEAVARANAAFIVRAVNHHEALVEIVRELSTALLEATASDDDASTRLAVRADMLILPFLIEAA